MMTGWCRSFSLSLSLSLPLSLPLPFSFSLFLSLSLSFSSRPLLLSRLLRRRRSDSSDELEDSSDDDSLSDELLSELLLSSLLRRFLCLPLSLSLSLSLSLLAPSLSLRCMRSSSFSRASLSSLACLRCSLSISCASRLKAWPGWWSDLSLKAPARRCSCSSFSARCSWVVISSTGFCSIFLVSTPMASSAAYLLRLSRSMKSLTSSLSRPSFSICSCLARRSASISRFFWCIRMSLSGLRTLTPSLSSSSFLSKSVGFGRTYDRLRCT
mmetsp:Transcript_4945/g.13386  ORF Transcript_4945/g.13386 Transcript_4945/m.13386 type:complete len:269 (-) Transcript_4945:60-866(-)